MTLPIRRLSRALVIPALAYVPVLALLGLQIRQAVRTADRQVGMTVFQVEEALRVLAVEEGGAAFRTGVEEGDLLMRLDETPARTLGPDDLEDVWRSSERVVVFRAGADPGPELAFDAAAPEPGEPLGLSSRPSSAGFLVTSVRPEGAAELAGLAVGDILLRVAGERVREVVDYGPLASGFERGVPVEFVVERPGGLVELSVEPGGSIPIGVLGLNTFIVLLYVGMGLVALAKRCPRRFSGSSPCSTLSRSPFPSSRSAHRPWIS